MASPAPGNTLILDSANWDAGNHQIFGTFTSSGSSGLLMMCMSANATLGQGSVPFTGVSSSGLVFTRRTGTTLASVNSLNLQSEVWTAPFSSALSQRVNFTFSSGNWNNGVFAVFEITGLYSTSDQWDANAAEPNNATNASVGLPNQSFTTDQAHDLLLYITNGVDSNTPAPDQAGWTLLLQHIDTAGVAFGNIRVNYKQVSVTQAGLVVSNSNVRGIGYIDALTGDAKSVLKFQTFVSFCSSG